MNLQHSAIWMAGVYLMLLMQFLENKVAVDLTRTEFVEAQEVGYMPSLMVLVLVSYLFITILLIVLLLLSDMFVPYLCSL